MKKLLIGIFALIMTVLSSNAQSAIPVPQASADTVTTAGGAYIYVPDSLRSDVMRLLQGHSRVVESWDPVKDKEQVLWNGDTINMVLKSRNLGRFDRGLGNYLFVPKGQWAIGLTVSYGEFTTKDLGLFDLLNDIDLGIYGFSINPYVKYSIANNVSIGLRLGYSSLSGNIGSFNIDIDEDMNFNIHDIMYRNESYSAGLTFSHYLGITRNGRFGIVNEVELAFSSGNSDYRRPYGDALKNTHTTYMKAALNFSPGVRVYVMENVSFNVSFGIFGFNLKNEKQTEDDVYLGNRFTSGAQFRFNIFNINFGLGIHI